MAFTKSPIHQIVNSHRKANAISIVTITGTARPWRVPGRKRHCAAAYQCMNGHIVDPATTHQCPRCGVHDTSPDASQGSSAFECHRCGNAFVIGG